MFRSNRKWLALIGALAVGVAGYVAFRREDMGQGRFFADQTFHFQTLRVLSDVASDGADISEVLETVKHIRSGDAQGWFRAWSETGDRVARLAGAAADRIAKGRALLHAHNYDVLTYDGPGQGSVLRDQGLTFTHEWEKPTKAVVDAFLASHARPDTMVLVGTSMGGYLAPRAAAFDERFDGVVAWDVLFDMGAVAGRYAPPAAFWLRDHGFAAVVDLVIRVKAALSPDFAWATSNGMWTLGTKHPLDTVTALQKYTLAGVAQRIKGDVLILAGAEDHFTPVAQVAQFEQALTAAHSVTTKIYDRSSGGAEHCQVGAQALWHADFFAWIAAKFGEAAIPAAAAGGPRH